MKDILTLSDAIHLAFSRPEYAPQIKRDEKGAIVSMTTHCNQFVNEVLSFIGFGDLEGKMANDIVDFIKAHPQWSEVSMDKCQALANAGTFVIAAIKAPVHGHVAIICPGKEKSSGRWGQVPSCASVGKENTIGRGINWAFSEMPSFYAYRPTL